MFQTALSDFYVEYRLVAQAIVSKPRPRAQVLADLHAHLQDVFNENGVQIMSPHHLGDRARPRSCRLSTGARRWRLALTRRAAAPSHHDHHLDARPLRSQYEDFMRHVDARRRQGRPHRHRARKAMFGYQMRFALDEGFRWSRPRRCTSARSRSSCCGSCAATPTRAGCRSVA